MFSSAADLDILIRIRSSDRRFFQRFIEEVTDELIHLRQPATLSQLDLGFLSYEYLRKPDDNAIIAAERLRNFRVHETHRRSTETATKFAAFFIGLVIGMVIINALRGS